VDNQLIKELQGISGDNSFGTTKHKKQASSSHDNSRTQERVSENSELQLTYDMLRNQKNNILPEISNPHPNYRYMWFAKDQQGQGNYYYATSKLGYSPVTVSEMPDMQGYIFSNELDSSITKNHIVVKEMILCKIHVDNWTKIMTMNHHILPTEAESGVKSKFNDQVKHGGIGVVGLNNRISVFEEDRDEKGDNVPYAYQTGLEGHVTKLKPSFV